MSNALSSLKSFLTQAKNIATAIGVALAGLNASGALVFVPAQAQHWVTGVILVLTVVARDVVDGVNQLAPVVAVKK